MRLDHLLSKETGKVGVALLSSCQGAVLCGKGRAEKSACGVFCESLWGRIERTTEHELMRSISEGEEGSGTATKEQQKTFLVAMRLGDTPVLIPNTMVKT